MAERLGLDVWTSGRGKVSGLGAGEIGRAHV